MTGTLRCSSRNVRMSARFLTSPTACSGSLAGHTIPSVYYAADEASALPVRAKGYNGADATAKKHT
jgi:hypothetical protein